MEKIMAKKVAILVVIVIMAQKHTKKLVIFSYIHTNYIHIRCVRYITYIHTTTDVYIHTTWDPEG